MDAKHLSNDGNSNSYLEMKEFNVRKKIASSFNRLKFLKDCLAEQVLPKSAPAAIKNGPRPFSNTARTYLEEACAEIKEYIYVIKDQRKGLNLTKEHEAKLKRLNTEQRNRLRRKLDDLCKNSKWKEAGNIDIVNNVSSRQLTTNEKEALALGLKFDSGKDKFSLAEHVERNYKYNESDADKGFIQGILTCCKALADSEPSSLPRRYLQALKDLANDKNIIITQADKGGGIVIMDIKKYTKKMEEMLSDQEVYKKMPAGHGKIQSKDFNKEARKILRKSERGKKLNYLIEEAPVLPKMRGLPKIHKDGMPMRPITSGIGSAPHKIAKILAKPLTKTLGTISDTHMKNTSDMMTRINEIRIFHDLKLASFDVKSLFTNVPVNDALDAIEKVVKSIADEDLPLPKEDYLKLVELCMNFGCFSFNKEEYVQHSGLAMGSPLSPVAACLFMEILEETHFLKIIGSDSIWLRYVDDVLIVVPKDKNLERTLEQLNDVHQRIKFTLEVEKEGMIAFLDTCIVKTSSGFKFKVHRKPTNKEDYVHFYSAHSDRIKSGIVIGFFLRALRICDKEYLNDEFNHIFEAFMKLKYPKGFLIKQKEKAERIMKRNSEDANDPRRKHKISKRWVTIPNSKKADIISRALEKTDIRVATNTGARIKEILSNKEEKNHPSEENSVVYEIPCKGCYKTYVGETGRGLDIRLKEHRSDVKFHRVSNAIVLHIEKCNHLPDWDRTRILEKNVKKQTRKTLEAAHIISRNTFNSRSGFITWSAAAAKLAVS